MRASRWPLSVLFLFTLLPQFSAVVGCKIWPAFAHLASVRLSVRGPFLPPALRTDTPRGERRGRRGRRGGRLPPEHPEAPLNASPPLVSTSSPSRSGTTSQRARERNRAGWRAGARSVSLGRCRARSLSVGRPAGRGCRRRGGIEERLGLLCSVGRLVSLCLFGFGDNEVAAVSDRPPQQAVGEERVGHLARWGRRPSVPSFFGADGHVIGGDTGGAGPEGEGLIRRRRGVRQSSGGESNNDRADGSIISSRFVVPKCGARPKPT